MRVCVVVTRKEREREECALNTAMLMQNSSFWGKRLLSARREGEKKNSSETLNPNFQKCLLFEVHFFDLSENKRSPQFEPQI